MKSKTVGLVVGVPIKESLRITWFWHMFNQFPKKWKNIFFSGTRSSAVHSQHQEPVPTRVHRGEGVQPLLRERSVQRGSQQVRQLNFVNCANGSFKNDVTQIWNFFDPLTLSCTYASNPCLWDRLTLFSWRHLWMIPFPLRNYTINLINLKMVQEFSIWLKLESTRGPFAVDSFGRKMVVSVDWKPIRKKRSEFLWLTKVSDVNSLVGS